MLCFGLASLDRLCFSKKKASKFALKMNPKKISLTKNQCLYKYNYRLTCVFGYSIVCKYSKIANFI